MWHYHFFYLYSQMWNEKRAAPPTFLCWGKLFTLPLYACILYETIFPYEGGHSIAHLIFKTCAQQRKDHFDLFLDTNTQARTYSGGAQGVQTSAPFLYSPNCVLKFFNQFRRNTLKSQFKKQKNLSKRSTNSILFKFFKATLRRVLINVE